MHDISGEQVAEKLINSLSVLFNEFLDESPEICCVEDLINNMSNDQSLILVSGQSDTLRQVLLKVQDALNRKSELIAAKEKEIRDKDRQIEQLRSENEVVGDDVKRKDYFKAIRDAERERDDFEEKVKVLEQKLQKAEKKSFEYVVQLEQKTKFDSSLADSTTKDLQDKASTLQRHLVLKDQRISELLDKIKTQEQTIADKDRQIEDFQLKFKKAVEQLNFLQSQRTRQMSQVKSQGIRFFPEQNCRQLQGDEEIGKGMYSVYKTVIDGETYAKKLIQDLKAQDFHQQTLEIIFTQMISNFDEKPDEEVLFIKLRGLSIRVNDKKQINIALFFDRMQGDLQKLVQGRKLQLRQKYYIMWKISKSVRILQEHSIVHCDIKPLNVLMDDSCRPYLADFGTVQFLDREEAKQIAQAYSIRWAPPELLGNGLINFGTDVWSLGCMMIYIFTGILPWQKFTDQDELKIKIIELAETNKTPLDHHQQHYRYSNPIPSDVKEIVVECFYKNHKKRASVHEIETNFEKLYHGINP